MSRTARKNAIAATRIINLGFGRCHVKGNKTPDGWWLRRDDRVTADPSYRGVNVRRIIHDNAALQAAIAAELEDA